MRLSTGRVPDEPEINLVSLIDVVFCLIIFLVVTTTFDQRSALKLVLPQSQANSEIDPGEPLTILVDAEGRFFIGNDEVLKRDVGSLREAITRVAGEDRERPVVLRADARTPHQSVVTAMDALGQAGFRKISIATTPEATP
ncbi:MULTISPECIES: biopolymer transporter ExbD [Arenimonas]|jgi:biopolymer transport protein ExbD|uniref:ExbD/TolR family protein n=1 Tax=Arenimonas TaxID=490567 RepID=UPI000551D38A|nr:MULTISPECIES: biopolymer transporter ExbD [Arenimonas]